MNRDIFEFWKEAAPNDTTHPRDRYVLDRVRHSFDLRCLPGPFSGPLRTAPVVLLYLTPGWSPEDIDEAATPEGQARYAERRTGHQPLEGPEDHLPGWKWWSSRTKVFGPWHQLRDKIAILEISGYHSRTFTNEHVLTALPSSRIALDWAQEVLFPQAERGDRVVICMRSPQYWGLGKRSRYGQSLFVPAVTRGGHMLRTGEHGSVRDEIFSTVREAIAETIRTVGGQSPLPRMEGASCTEGNRA
jgi:hypothetical protein